VWRRGVGGVGGAKREIYNKMFTQNTENMVEWEGEEDTPSPHQPSFY